jgi:nucleoside 2-deoxyribosyltransferase
VKVYLAGPINGCTDDEANDWRTEAKRLLPGIVTLDPMRRDYRGRESQPGVWEEIQRLDREDIQACDVVLVNAAVPSWGTARELEYAITTLGKPVVVIAPRHKTPSPWLRDAVLFPEVSFACSWIRNVLGGGK